MLILIEAKYSGTNRGQKRTLGWYSDSTAEYIKYQANYPP